jgi:hypothetical protein
MDAISQIDYNLFSQNCRTDTVEILEAYGVTGLPGGARPSGFFGGVNASIQPLLWAWPQFALDVSLYTETDQFGLRDDLSLADPGTLADPACNQRSDDFQDAPQPVISCVAVRRGAILLYPDQNYGGVPVIVKVDEILNFRNLPWADKTIRSYCSSTLTLDPATIATMALDPRFNTPAERNDHLSRLALPPIFGPQDRAELMRHGV